MKKTMIALSLALILVLSACGAGSGTTGEKTEAKSAEATVITADEAYERMNSGDPVVIVDVRTAEEYAENHIPGAILLPNEEIGDTPPAALPVQDAEILVYCRSGNRSAQAAKKLADMGYTKVYDFGGINSWTYETVSGEYATPEKAGTLSSFTAYDLNGIARDESIFADYELTMINVWATFCGPCISEMPELGKLAEEYKDKGVRIVGIAVDMAKNSDGTFSQASVDEARRIVAETGAAYLHLLPSADLEAALLGGMQYVPETVFVDSEGNIVGESYTGSRSGDDWAAIIDGLLAK